MNEQSFKIEEMLPYLKNHILFFCVSDGKKKYFHYIKESIMVQDINSRYKLTENDFLQLYKDATFYIYETKDEIEIDIEKDKEYYSWKQ